MEKRTGTVLSRKTAASTSKFLSVPSAVCMYLQCFFQQFFIDYQIAGANILPDITVIER